MHLPPFRSRRADLGARIHHFVVGVKAFKGIKAFNILRCRH